MITGELSVAGPTRMRAAVYRGPNRIGLEEVPVPSVESGEILVQVQCCGICGTDLKKIEHGLQPPPRVYGHEIAGTICCVGSEVRRWKVGQRVVVHHHIPCRKCFYCQRRLYAHCPRYLETGTTAGFDPAGGGFAQFVRVRDWVVAEGVVEIPEDVTFEEATFVEPVNTCLKAVERLGPLPGEMVLLMGLGPIGMILLQLLHHRKCSVLACDPLSTRRALARKLGAMQAVGPEQLENFVRQFRDSRGADSALLACDSGAAIDQAIHLTRPGARIMVFAHTRSGQRHELDVGRICVEDKVILGSYSASIDLQEEAARLVFEHEIEVAGLITHRFSLREVSQALALASRPSENSLKVVIHPQLP